MITFFLAYVFYFEISFFNYPFLLTFRWVNPQKPRHCTTGLKKKRRSKNMRAFITCYHQSATVPGKLLKGILCGCRKGCGVACGYQKTGLRTTCDRTGTGMVRHMMGLCPIRGLCLCYSRPTTGSSCSNNRDAVKTQYYICLLYTSRCV